MDNYYTSVALFEELQERKTLVCGTVRSSRVDLPKEICDSRTNKVKFRKKGKALCRQRGNLTCVTWHDREPVSVLSTIPRIANNSSIVQRSVKVNGH